MGFRAAVCARNNGQGGLLTTTTAALSSSGVQFLKAMTVAEAAATATVRLRTPAEVAPEADARANVLAARDKALQFWILSYSHWHVTYALRIRHHASTELSDPDWITHWSNSCRNSDTHGYVLTNIYLVVAGFHHN